MTMRRKYPSWQRRHEGVFVWQLENPTAKLSECAKATGYSPSQISRIVHSPKFQHRMQETMDAMVDNAIKRFTSRHSDLVPIEQRSWDELLS